LIGQLGLLFHLSGLIRKNKIGVVRAGDPLYLGLLGWLLARINRIPLVVRVGGNNEKVYQLTGKPIMPRLFRSRRVERSIERFVLSRADLVAGANQDNLNFALSSGARPSRTTLFRYGNLIDRAHFQAPVERNGGEFLLQELNIQPYHFLLYVGRLEAIKRVDHVIRVLSDLRTRGHHHLKLLIVGDGSMLSELRQLAGSLNMKDIVVFAGNRDQEWLAKVIPLAAAVASPHTGRALAEAALGGAPIIAYDVDWQSELITSGRTGELVPEDDWETMARKISSVVSDRDYARRLGGNLRKAALEMMDPRTLTENEILAYKRLLGD